MWYSAARVMANKNRIKWMYMLTKRAREDARMKYIYWGLGAASIFFILGLVAIQSPTLRINMHSIYMDRFYFHEGNINEAFEYASRWNNSLDKSIIMGLIYHETGNVSALCGYDYNPVVRREFEAICLAVDFKYKEIVERYSDTQLYSFALAFEESFHIHREEFFSWLARRKITPKDGAILYADRFGIESMDEYCSHFKIRLIECEIANAYKGVGVIDYNGFSYADKLISVQYFYYLTGNYYFYYDVKKFKGCNTHYYECIIYVAIASLVKGEVSAYEYYYKKAVLMWPGHADNDYLLLEKYVYFCDKHGFDKVVKEKNMEAIYSEWADIEKCGTSE